jgi:hypothetical protein
MLNSQNSILVHDKINASSIFFKKKIKITCNPSFDKLGKAYLAIAIPQNIILTIPDNLRWNATKYEAHGTVTVTIVSILSTSSLAALFSLFKIFF